MLRAVFLLASTLLAATGDEAAIRQLEAQWDAATLKGDADALDRIFDEAFLSTGDDGVVRTKAQVVGELRARNLKYETARSDELKVYLHGDAAVVSGRWRGAYTYKGVRKQLVERFTNFYVRKNGTWKCVAAHGSAIR